MPVSEAKIEGNAISFSGQDFAYRGRVEQEAIVGELTRNGRTSPLTLVRAR